MFLNTIFETGITLNSMGHGFTHGIQYPYQVMDLWPTSGVLGGWLTTLSIWSPHWGFLSHGGFPVTMAVSILSHGHDDKMISGILRGKGTPMTFRKLLETSINNLRIDPDHFITFHIHPGVIQFSSQSAVSSQALVILILLGRYGFNKIFTWKARHMIFWISLGGERTSKMEQIWILLSKNKFNHETPRFHQQIWQYDPWMGVRRQMCGHPCFRPWTFQGVPRSGETVNSQRENYVHHRICLLKMKSTGCSYKLSKNECFFPETWNTLVRFRNSYFWRSGRTVGNQGSFFGDGKGWMLIPLVIW